LNLHTLNGRQPLKLVCLPISPPGQVLPINYWHKITIKISSNNFK
jgi:hypothetical protein